MTAKAALMRRMGALQGPPPICSLRAQVRLAGGFSPLCAGLSKKLEAGRLPPEQVTQEKPGRSCNAF